MKTVIHYKSGSFLGITETWIYGQIKNLKKYKPIVYAFCAENLDIYPIKDIRTFRLCKKGFFNNFNLIYFINKICYRFFNFCPTFFYFLSKDKPCLIHAHFGPSGFSILRIKYFHKIPLITTFYGYDMSMLPQQHPRWKKRYMKLFAQGEKFLVEGNHMKKCLIKLGCPAAKIEVFHLGVDLEIIKYAPRSLDSENQTVKILISSSFREKKGLPYAIEAIGQIYRDSPEIDFELTVIGDSNGSKADEIEKRKIIETIDKYKLNNKVKMLGYCSHNLFVEELYKNHIFLHPSICASDGDTEGGAPVSIIEASASGMPVLSTLHCDIPEIVINNKSGFLVPERDVTSLEEKLRYLMLNNSLWTEMGLNGRKHIEEEYSIKKQAVKLEEIYDNCTK